jgi:hypothetical protein
MISNHDPGLVGPFELNGCLSLCALRQQAEQDMPAYVCYILPTILVIVEWILARLL